MSYIALPFRSLISIPTAEKAIGQACMGVTQSKLGTLHEVYVAPISALELNPELTVWGHKIPKAWQYLVRHYHVTYNEPCAFCCLFPTKGQDPWWQWWGQETCWWFLHSGSITWKHWRRACRSTCGAMHRNTHSSTACMRFFQLTLATVR